VDIVNAYDYIQALIHYLPEGNKLREYYDDVTKPLKKFAVACLTDAECPKCGNRLYVSDLEDYDYVCTYCDENSYECEIMWSKSPTEATTNIEEEDEMKKYELKNYKEFCDEALTAPPFEEFDDGTSDEGDWFASHKIQIIANNCVMELDYDADAINEIDYALREIHEAILGSGEATTGNTFGSEYRPAELKDVVRHFIMCRYENYGGLNWFDYAKQAVVEMSDIKSVIGLYEHACKIEKDIEFKCNWHNFKMESLKDATEEGIKKIILDLVGSDLEISYDPSTDKSFIIDYTFKESGDFIDWSWGKLDEHSDGLNVLLESYKVCIFE
jgi:hypothetical protein